jgi:predicted component of type VI protein secretion system
MVEPLAEHTRDLYAAAEERLLGIIARSLADGLDAPQWAERKLSAVQALRRAAQATLDETGRAVTLEVFNVIADAWNVGHQAAVAELGVLDEQTAAMVRRNAPNAADADRLAEDTVQRVTGRHRSIVRTIVDRFRATVANVTALVTFGRTRQQATQDAMQQWADQGITSFVDQSGRRWKLASYAEMAVRTSVGRAAVEGHMRSLASAGYDLVIVSDAPLECPLCRPWERHILSIAGPPGRRTVEVEHATQDGVMVQVPVSGSLDEARLAGLQHPNCRHSVSAYTPGITPFHDARPDPAAYEASQRQRAIERTIRKYKNRAAASVDPAAQKRANAKVRDWQKAMREHLAAHPDLIRYRDREQPGAGNLPPRLPQTPDEAMQAARIRSGDDRTPREMSDAELAAAMRFGNLDARDRARIMQEADRRDLAALMNRAAPGGRLVADLIQFSDTELGRIFGQTTDEGDRLRIMTEMDRRDLAAGLPGVRPDLVGLSDDQLAARSRGADPALLADLAAEAHRRDLLARLFPGGRLADDLAGIGDDELAWCMQYAEPAEILRIAAEMDRRDAVTLPPPVQTGDPVADLIANRRAVDDSLAPAPPPEQWGRYADTEQPTDDGERDEPEQRITLAQARELYREYVYTQWLQAEEDCRGVLLTKQAQTARVDAESLFSGPAHIAYARASDELKAWWAEHGRLTQVEFIEQATGRTQRGAATARKANSDQQQRR